MAAVCAFVFASPATAQVAGSPGDQHTPTVYTKQFKAETQGGPGFSGPSGVLGGITAPLGALTGVGPQGRCRVEQDFNGRYTALCGP
jgi:hypothetical protein